MLHRRHTGHPGLVPRQSSPGFFQGGGIVLYMLRLWVVSTAPAAPISSEAETAGPRYERIDIEDFVPQAICECQQRRLRLVAAVTLLWKLLCIASEQDRGGGLRTKKATPMRRLNGCGQRSPRQSSPSIGGDRAPAVLSTQTPVNDFPPRVSPREPPTGRWKAARPAAIRASVQQGLL